MRNLLLLCVLLVVGGSCDAQTTKSNTITNLESHPGVRLIEQYVAGDTAGRRLHHDPWFANAVIWEDEPAYDHYFVVRSLTFTPLSGDSSTARVRVTYDRIGSVTNTAPDSLQFEQGEIQEITVFTAVLTDNGWRIAAPQQPYHVQVGPLLEKARLSAESRARLQALAPHR
jgi:hypothetical protein